MIEIVNLYQQLRLLYVKECTLSNLVKRSWSCFGNVIHWRWRARCTVVFEGCQLEAGQEVERVTQQVKMFYRLCTHQGGVTQV